MEKKSKFNVEKWLERCRHTGNLNAFLREEVNTDEGRLFKSLPRDWARINEIGINNFNSVLMELQESIPHISK